MTNPIQEIKDWG